MEAAASSHNRNHIEIQVHLILSLQPEGETIKPPLQLLCSGSLGADRGKKEEEEEEEEREKARD